jgi:hypothetical protein
MLHKTEGLENRALRKISGHRRNDLMRVWKKLQNEAS